MRLPIYGSRTKTARRVSKDPTKYEPEGDPPWKCQDCGLTCFCSDELMSSLPHERCGKKEGRYA